MPEKPRKYGGKTLEQIRADNLNKRKRVLQEQAAKAKKIRDKNRMKRIRKNNPRHEYLFSSTLGTKITKLIKFLYSYPETKPMVLERKFWKHGINYPIYSHASAGRAVRRLEEQAAQFERIIEQEKTKLRYKKQDSLKKETINSLEESLKEFREKISLLRKKQKIKPREKTRKKL